MCSVRWGRQKREVGVCETGALRKIIMSFVLKKAALILISGRVGGEKLQQCAAWAQQCLWSRQVTRFFLPTKTSLACYENFRGQHTQARRSLLCLLHDKHLMKPFPTNPNSGDKKLYREAEHGHSLHELQGFPQVECFKSMPSENWVEDEGRILPGRFGMWELNRKVQGLGPFWRVFVQLKSLEFHLHHRHWPGCLSGRVARWILSPMKDYASWCEIGEG